MMSRGFGMSEHKALEVSVPCGATHQQDFVPRSYDFAYASLFLLMALSYGGNTT